MLTSRSRIGAVILAIGGILLSPILSTSARADDTRRCSTANTAGHYGFIGDGSAFSGNALGLPVGPFATAGTFDLLPDGRYRTLQTITFNGQVAKAISLEGTWSVTPDCVFTDVSPTSPDNGYGAVVDGGREIFRTEAVPGVVASFTIKRVDADK